MFTTVKSSELTKFGTWSAPFYLSSGYSYAKGKSSAEIIAHAVKILKDVDNYKLELMHKFVNRRTIGGWLRLADGERAGVSNVASMLSSAVEKKLGLAVEHRDIFRYKTTQAEALQIAVVIAWLFNAADGKHPKNKAIAKRDELLKQLADLNKYIGEQDEIFF